MVTCWVVCLHQVTGEPLIRRSDDTADALTKRLGSYHKSTKPLVDYYAKRGIHTLIDASLHPAIVFGDIVKAFDQAQAKRGGAAAAPVPKKTLKQYWPFSMFTSKV